MNLQKLEKIRPKIEALEAIPTVPAIVQPLSAMLQLPPDQVDVDGVVKLVSYDGTIAAHCLRMANSPLFGRRKTETVRTAILALGMKRVQAILMGLCLNRIIPNDKWAFDPEIFWRHALGCALVSRKLAKLIGYDDPEKAYLAGLLHDLGMLVNTLTCTEDYRTCLQAAREARVAVHCSEEEHLGFTHCQSGKILGQRWNFSAEVMEVIEFHHTAELNRETGPLVSLVHLSDLLCRLRDLGYGYYEAMGVHFSDDPAWASLAKQCPGLAKVDLARLTMDIDGAMDDIIALVNTVFKPQPLA